jgi:hypothetical protein
LKAVYFKHHDLLGKLLSFGITHGASKYRTFLTIKESVDSGER